MATRWPIAPRFLFDYDNVNFALALRQFAPLLSQPHRGYPLYVAVSKLIYLLGFSPEWTALLMGLLGSVIALTFLVPLAREMFGDRAARIAPVLLFCHPAFIMAGALDHVRTFLAAGAIATALYVWRGQLKTAAFVLGIAGGFRTELAPVLFPLFILAPLLLARVSWKRMLAPLAILGLTIAPWFFFTIARSGGFSAAMHYQATTLSDNARSFFYQGFTRGAAIMALFAIYWNGIGAPAWLWALPAAWRSRVPGAGKQFAFLALWFAPPFLLNAVVQITDPDQVLASVAALCLLGAWALSALSARWTVVAAAISVGVFLFPLVRMGREASLPWIRGVIVTETKALDGIRRVPGPRLIRIQGDYPTWRLVSYYFPDDWIEQSGMIYHANRQNDAAPRIGTRLVVDLKGEVSRGE